MAERKEGLGWEEDDAYWRQNYRNRPYASSGDQAYDYYQPGYRFGYESANRLDQDRSWNDVEADLSRSWESYEHRGSSTWQQVKDAARDAWDRVTGNRNKAGVR
jgi:hypothetical protein